MKITIKAGQKNTVNFSSRYITLYTAPSRLTLTTVNNGTLVLIQHDVLDLMGSDGKLETTVSIETEGLTDESIVVYESNLKPASPKSIITNEVGVLVNNNTLSSGLRYAGGTSLLISFQDWIKVTADKAFYISDQDGNGYLPYAAGDIFELSGVSTTIRVMTQDLITDTIFDYVGGGIGIGAKSSPQAI